MTEGLLLPYSQRGAAQLPGGGVVSEHGPVDYVRRGRGEAEDVGVGPRGRATADGAPDVPRLGAALWGIRCAGLEGRGPVEDHELQGVLPELPHRCQELPQGVCVCV